MKERRKSLRRGLHLPTLVRAQDVDGAWEERATTTDVANGGISLTLERLVPMGQVLFLSLPLPEIFRRHDLKAQAYRVYGLVRHVRPGGPPYRIGVMLLGKHPPRGYEEDPTALVFLPSDPQAQDENRMHTRYPVTVTMRLKRFSPPAEELTITENMSLGGARLRTSLDLIRGQMVQVAEMDGPFSAQAMVLSVKRGPDNMSRVNVYFTLPDQAEPAAHELLRRQGIAAE